MDIIVDGNRAITIQAKYSLAIAKLLPLLEGSKRWLKNGHFSFEHTAYNIELWRRAFPSAFIGSKTPSEPIQEAADRLFEVAGGRPAFRFKTQPRAHQSRALDKLANLRSCGLFMDIGTGKSWTAIAMIGKRWCESKSDHVLLIAKNGIHFQWAEEQLPEHMSEAVNWQVLVHSKANNNIANLKFEKFLKFDGLKIYCINIDAIITSNGNDKIVNFLQSAGANATILIDESQDIKNWASARTKAAAKFGSLCKYKIIMTGTPIARDLVDMFSQLKFLDERIIGHRYITTYRNHYCIFEQTNYGPKIIGHKNVEEFFKRIDPFIFRITSEEALDLPPKNYITRNVILCNEQLSVMKELKDNFFSEFENKKTFVTHAATLLTRLQQISCGFLPLEDGSIRIFKNPRMEELGRIIDQLEGKIIIWCRFRQDIKNVMKFLGKSAVDYFGETKEVDRKRNIAAFLDPASQIRFLVASPEAAGTGLNLQGECRKNIYYSNSFNALARWQSEGRTWRDGTTGTIDYFDLIARGSPDKKILANLKNKKSISDLALDDLRKILKGDDNEYFN